MDAPLESAGRFTLSGYLEPTAIRTARTYKTHLPRPSIVPSTGRNKASNPYA